jgi:hypothetical protein
VTRRSFLVGQRAAFRSVTCSRDGTPSDLITYGLKFIYRMASYCVQIVYMLINNQTKLYTEYI